MGARLGMRLAIAFVCASAGQGQVSLPTRPHAAASSGAHLRIDPTLVLVPVTVSDHKDRLITGLERDRFRIFDNQVEQAITQFAQDDAPLAVGLVFDGSRSMGKKLPRAGLAAKAFLEEANPDDEFFLVTFNDRPSLAVPFTTSAEEIQSRLALARPKGSTALLDAVVLAMNQLKKSTKPRKALLIVSDGGDNSSRYTEAEVRSLVRESDVLIYGIGIYEAGGARGRTPEEWLGPTLLAEIAEETGGRELAVDNLKELPDTAAKIGRELRNRYVLGFTPANLPRDGRYHRLQVKLVQPRGMPKLEAHWRLGYYAPSE